MIVSSIVVASFTAAHSHEPSREHHGHTWTVRIEIIGLEAGLVEGSLADVASTVERYNGHDLDRFLPGVATDPAGLAAFFRELLSAYPISAISVATEQGWEVRVEWVAR